MTEKEKRFQDVPIGETRLCYRLVHVSVELENDTLAFESYKSFPLHMLDHLVGRHGFERVPEYTPIFKDITERHWEEAQPGIHIWILVAKYRKIRHAENGAENGLQKTE